MYYDTATNKLRWWSGSAWVNAEGGGAGTPEVHVSASAPSPRVGETIWIDTDEFGGVPAAGLVTSLPSSPIDGQECYYLADDANGVIWHLRYRAASASPYKWEVVGGSALHAYVAARQTKAAGGAFGALATAGPSITVPVAGDYRVQVSSHQIPPGATFAVHSYDVGGTGALEADGAYSTIRTAGDVWSLTSPEVLKTVAASTAFVSKYMTSPLGCDFMSRSMRVTPVRVG